ncbi:hypothetical protein QP713_12045 [Neisseria mucosa]|nr:hypothetical protein [Neisseria mucosa]MDK6727488.1 hypothetical protein [Neisseria mucosa]MDK6871815.1 hypothetical protein [Neisseria mucosa]MDK8111474.1 hypothetical protein [Neisseria mucosa]
MNTLLGGYVLKLLLSFADKRINPPAAFRRLCVEIDDLYRTGD